MVLSKSLRSWYVIIADSAVVVSYLNVLSHWRFNIIRTSLWKYLFLLVLAIVPVKMVRQIKQDIMKMIKPFARGTSPEGRKRQHHFSFCFVFLNMVCAWNNSAEVCSIHWGAESGTSDSILTWLMQEGTKRTIAISLFRCSWCFTPLFSQH